MEAKDLQQVMKLVVQAHAGQFRKGIFSQVPYVQHLFDVHKRVVYYLNGHESHFYTHPVVIQSAALMHDLVEDTDVTLEDIRSLFGDLPASIVGELTRPESAEKTRKDKYKFLEGYKEKSIEAIYIKIADRYSNVMDYLADPNKQVYASFYALQAYPVYQAYIKAGGDNIRIFDDLHELDEVVRRRYPSISIFTDYAEKVVRGIATARPVKG